MKKPFKILLIVILILFIGVGAFFSYLYFIKSDNRKAFSLIPYDAFLIVETTDLNKAVVKINESNIWKYLLKNPALSKINDNINTIDRILKDNPILDKIFRDREMLISLHMTNSNNFDFLFIINIQKGTKLSFLAESAKLFNYTSEKRLYKGNEIYVLSSPNNEKEIFIGMVDNLMLISFSQTIIEDSILQKNEDQWNKNELFQKVNNEIIGDKLFSLYVNYHQLNRYLRSSMSSDNSFVSEITNSLAFTAMNINLENDKLSFDGYTDLKKDSSYLKALLKVNPGKSNVEEIISTNAAAFMSINFDSFNEFYNNLTEQFKTEKPAYYQSYLKNYERIEYYLGINLKSDFFSWIGKEIAVIKMEPADDSRIEDVIVAIDTVDIAYAQKGLGHITDQLKARSPVSFRLENYNNTPIYYMEISGLSKLFFGEIFNNLEKPYFTYLGNYVVFSNSMPAMINFIDDYNNGKILANIGDFMKFKESLNSKSNVNMIMLTPKLYSNLYFYSNDEKRNMFKENRDFIFSFDKIAFQLVSDKEMFKTTIQAAHNPEAAKELEISKLEASASEFGPNMEITQFKVNLFGDALKTNGAFSGLNPADGSKLEGTINKGKLSGAWVTHYTSGNIKMAATYKNNNLDGAAVIYFDEPANIKKCEMTFSDDEISGSCIEYYPTGNRKAVVIYDENKLNGAVEYFYNSGAIKIKGNYKKGKRNGEWIYYDENAQPYKTEKWNNGIISK